MPRTVTKEQWDAMMANSGGEAKKELRRERREGKIEITGLSRKKEHVMARARRRGRRSRP